MALGAMERFPELSIKIVGCGLKYFNPHKFRSKAMIEFSEPYEVPRELVEEYKTDKREAVSKLLKRIERRMRDVVFHADNYEELQSIYQARRFYISPEEEKNMSKTEINNLYKKFTEGYDQLQNEPEVRKLIHEIKHYRKEIKSIGIFDY